MNGPEAWLDEGYYEWVGDDEAMQGIEFPKTAVVAGREVEVIEGENFGLTNVLLIAGSRDITDVWNEIEWACHILGYPIDRVIHGGARGVDQAADDWAKGEGYDVKEFLAKWNTYGKRAGYMRNAEMVKLADTAIIIWDGESRGTYNTLQLVANKGIPYVLVKL